MRRRLSRCPALLRALLPLAPLLAAGCDSEATADARNGEVAVVVRQYPHDAQAYTQGLVFHGGQLYESTGQLTHSSVRRVDVETGAVQQRTDLPADRFGEGLALVDDRLIQVTWTSGVGYIYDRATLALQDSFTYQGQGWGLAYDGTHLILSDGTATLKFMDPGTFEVVRTIEVQDNGAPLDAINELEWVDGEIFANVYQTEYIVRIDPQTGNVLSWIDAKNVYPRAQRPASTDVLNGIAWDAAARRLFITGKWWPVLFEVEIRPQS
jgi:glutaminyl-peptide cyclotransferase